MDRVIVYDGALPQVQDVLNAGKFALQGQAYQDLAILGSPTSVAGLACTPMSPTPTLQVQVGIGSIYQMDPTDATAYGDLGVDNNNILKQGILNSPVTLTITPPGTAGQSQVYLVQAILSDIDSGSMVLSYYNSANPASPFSGPANAGSSNYTVRQNTCAIALKAGVAAATGSQLNPTPDLGYTALYYITVANGQTQITSGNIVQVPTAPFFPTLPAVPADVQNGIWVWGVDTGTANHLIVTLAPPSPIPTVYTAGMGLRVKALNANTGTTDINVNGIGVVGLKRAGGGNVVSGDIVSGQVMDLVYDGTNFQMANYVGISAGSTTNNYTYTSIPYVADTGTTNALVGTYSPAITSGQQVAGLWISIKLANTITGACTINVNGLGTKNVTLGNGSAPSSGLFVAGQILLLCYDGTKYQIESTSAVGTGPQGPAGPAGAIGPAGAQGVPGTVPLTPGAIGTYAFGFTPGSGGGLAYDSTGSNVYPGTWQIVSSVYNLGTAGGFSGYAFVLAQRIA